MTTPHFDLFVVGGGSGGVRAARVAAGYGAKVAIAEADRFGGVNHLEERAKLTVWKDVLVDERVCLP